MSSQSRHDSSFLDAVQRVGVPKPPKSAPPSHSIRPPSYWKRFFDFWAALSLLLLLAPFLFLISILIVLESPGSPLFSQWRRGFRQKRFRMFKLRTMVPGAHLKLASVSSLNNVDGIIFKIKNDPRTTRLGRLLREYSIDEIPQLINVLRGEMSLVGPRPLPLEDFARANFYHPLYRRWVKERHLMTPGLTGLWQVSGRNNLPFSELMRLDLHYVNHWNPFLDLKILIRTMLVVITHHGAY